MAATPDPLSIFLQFRHIFELTRGYGQSHDLILDLMAHFQLHMIQLDLQTFF